MWTVKEIAKDLNINEKTVRRWMLAGILPYRRINTRIRVTNEDYAKFRGDKEG